MSDLFPWVLETDEVSNSGLTPTDSAAQIYERPCVIDQKEGYLDGAILFDLPPIQDGDPKIPLTSMHEASQALHKEFLQSGPLT